ncbi:MAG: glycosyltransferase [Myxococcales bacterium]|nr:glycosyltransferase [Myxococcales bacterium]
MRRARTDVVIPAQDAERELPTALDRAALREAHAVIVVDRASRDGTAGIARDLGAVVLREPSGGYGAACLRALAHFGQQPEPPEVVAFVPADARLDAEQLGRLLAPIVSGEAELTISGTVDPRLRDRAIGRLIDTVYGQRFGRPGPVRAIRYPALVALGMSDRGAGWDVEMLVRALRLGLNIVEVDLGTTIVPSRSSGVRAACAAGGRTLFHILRHATVR